MTNKTILLVDDDASLRRVLAHHLSEAGYQVLTAANGKEGLDVFTSQQVEMVITDIQMPELSGLELMRRISVISPDVVVLVITAYGSIETAVEAMKLGAYDYITKPFNREELLLTVSKGLQYTALVRENRSLKQFIESRFSLDNMIGSSSAMRRVYALVEKVARTDLAVLITGESGTGKELIAKAIHQNSVRRDGPFVVINCGAIPEGLIESELFGHRKGSFTGAYTDARGKLEAADKGTVLLDEIGDLPLALQVKLLRVLEDGEFTRVGETTTRRIDVRFLAATNRDLSKMVADGRFREDLFFRLKVVPVHLPPLRERREDIPLLADYFLKELAQRYQRPELNFEKDIFRYFQTYSWPGNVRELKHTVERLAVIAEGDTVSISDLPENMTAMTGHAANVLIQLPDDGIDLEEVEREILRQALDKHDWNQTRAAQYLNITRSALIYRMQKYGLQSAEPAEDAQKI
ncbi:MAG: sigma-54-dependent transcriptional regulator [Blastocatellales bacterium]|jgi:two-component system NtrC family response regulator|nr:sigma-54 dependent transcriptional regulator [Nitrosomonas nitrosa]